MKAVFISYDQAHYDNILKILDRTSNRGFTGWEYTQGRGTKTGEPHYGSHAWPSVNGSIMTMVEDEKVDSLLNELKKLDDLRPALGLRAFVMNIEKAI